MTERSTSSDDATETDATEQTGQTEDPGTTRTAGSDAAGAGEKAEEGAASGAEKAKEPEKTPEQVKAEKAEAERRKKADAALAEKEAAEKKAAEDAAKPENWDLKIPDGVTISNEQRTRLNELAAEQGLTQAQIEAGIPVFAQALAENMERVYTETLAAHEAASKEEFGENYRETVGQAEAFVQRYGARKDADGKSDNAAAVLDIMRSHGMLKHPDVLRLLKAADDATRDDRGVTSGQSRGGETKRLTLASIYDHPTSNPKSRG